MAEDAALMPAPDAQPDSAADTASDDNPFAGFETHFLANGVKVWFKRLAGAPNVSISVGIPYGADDDPEGLEGIAHFTEHMLFSDHRGQTEQEIKEQIEGIGGRRNAFTTPDQTWYYVTIAKEEGLFALEWLARLMEPHAMDPEVVDRNREPVALEIRARPRELAEQISALLNPSWLRLPDFWAREFGMETRSIRSYDRWNRLQSITPDDLRKFYETHYVPSKMTVTVVGDMDRDEVLARAQATFGALLPRAATVGPPSIEDPGTSRITHWWQFRSNVLLDQRVKFFEPTADDLLRLEFLSDLLGRRLNQRLRYGDRKAVYGITAATIQRGPAALLQIRAGINDEDLDFAKGVISEELESLRSGALSAADFASDRTALVERLKNETNTAESLNRWGYRRFYDPDVHRDFPDVLGFYQSVTQEELAEFAAGALVPVRTTTRIGHVIPVSQALLAGSIVLVLWITLRLSGWALTKPIAMADLRYVARFRVPLPLAVVRYLAAGMVGLSLGRLLVFGFEWAAFYWVEPMDVFWSQSAAYAGMGLTAVVLAITYLSRIPRKLLVFPDHIRIKSLAFRSRVLVPEEVSEISTRRLPGVWLKKDILRTSLMAFGIIKPGIYLRPQSGRHYFFRSRNTQELAELLQQWWGGRGAQPTATADPEPEDTPPPPSDPPKDDLDIDSLEIDDPELEALLRANP